MESLSVTLNTLYDVLKELEGTLAEEINQLSQLHINPVSLQMISDNKLRLLSSINFFDEQRKKEGRELQLDSPYLLHPPLKVLWENITLTIKKSGQLNQKSFQLLEMHMKKVNEIKKIVKASAASATLYGENGYESDNASGKVYRISI